jgi:CheY-like chemotaxis protein
VRTLRAFLADDNRANAELIEQTLSLELDSLGYSVIWERDRDAISARQTVRRLDPFDFAIVDLFLNEHEEQDGIDVLRDLKAKDSRTFILLVTSYPQLSPGFRDDAAPYCTYAIMRDELRKSRRWSFEVLAREILEHITAHGLIELGEVKYDSSDPAILSLLEHVGRSVAGTWQEHDSDKQLQRAGERIIRNLAIKCIGGTFDEATRFHVSHLTQGRSGSHVCRVDLQRRDEQIRAFVLKFGIDRRMLERECRANLLAQKSLSEQVLVAVTGPVKSDVSGYHAITAQVAPDAITLAEWLQSAVTNAAASVVSEVLLSEALRPLFAADAVQNVLTQTWLTPSATEIARARSTLVRYVPALSSPHAGNVKRVDRELRKLNSFIEVRPDLIAKSAAVPKHVYYTRSFGDLHSRNVLVQSKVLPRPVLIDASLFGMRHWASDAARLVVDLFLRIRRPGVDAMMWNDFDESVEAGLRLCPRSHLVGGSGTSPVDAFISHSIVDIPKFTNALGFGLSADEWHWQWHVALAKEFLRQASHEDLAPARATLAILLAARHLRWSTALLRRAT